MRAEPADTARLRAIPGRLPSSVCGRGHRHLPPRGKSFLALDSTHRDALGEILLERQKHDDDRHGSQRGTGHDQTVVGRVLGLQLGNAREIVSLLVLDSMISCMK